MLSVKNLSVRFDAVQALDSVDIDIENGLIHALAGENGSGKSTLLKSLGGAVRPTEGSIHLNGQEITLSNPTVAASHGIGLIFQELSLFPNFSGYANVMIGQEPARFGLVSRKAIKRHCDRLIEALDFPQIDLSQPVGQLAVAEQQMVEVLKCLSRQPNVILFDEPTASLTSREVGPLLNAMRQLKDEGYTVVFVSHYLEEVFAVTDRVTVLRDGAITLDALTAELDSDQVVQAMLGRPLTALFPDRSESSRGDVFLQIENLADDRLAPVDLQMRRGEIVGIAGAVGSGSSRLGEIIGGLSPSSRGYIQIDGRRVAINSAKDALNAGIAYVPEDRRTNALLQNLSAIQNISLPLLASPDSPIVRGWLGFVKARDETRLAVDQFHRMKVRPDRPKLPARNFSGGNQQKIVLGRWFIYDRPCIVFNNPTKGIDVGSKAEIYTFISDLANSGHLVIFISNHNPEILGIADRIIIFREGELVGDFNRDELDEEALLAQTTGGIESVA